MFCPKCGKADQASETYCRHCGVFLPNLAKLFKSETPPAEHFKSNTVLAVLTIVASFTLAALLYAVLGFQPNTHPLIYVAASFFVAIGGWQIQTLIRTLMLKKQFERRVPLAGIATINVIESLMSSRVVRPEECWNRPT
ncbi:MAG: zinc ribbon domain-containing protein [Pyrinomonadaceae bacterium]